MKKLLSFLSEKFPLYPFLLALYPALALYANNLEITRNSHLLQAILTVIAGTALIFFLGGLLLRNAGAAAAFSALFVVLFFSYGHVYSLVERYFFGFLRLQRGGTSVALTAHYQLHLALSGLYLLMLAAGILFLFIRRRQSLVGLSKTFNVFTLALIAFPLFSVASYWAVSLFDEIEGIPYFQTELTASNDSAPDIYYIILDGYAREDVLKQYYAFDNQDFLDFLRAQGFVIATRSHANYNWTYLSLSSSLNFKYLDLPAKKAHRKKGLPYQLLSANQALRFVRSHGYRYVHVGSTWGGTLDNPNADTELNCSGAFFTIDFHRVLAESTWLKVFERRIADDLADCALESFSNLAASAKLPEPKFVFAHIPMPHHPYLFDRQGVILQRIVLSDQVDRQKILWAQKDKYLDQLIFVNKKIKTVIEGILRDSRQPPIIILQSDHRPTLHKLPKSERRLVRFRNFAAFLLPGGRAVIPDTITPVNELRLIFNAYFGANLEILPNRQFSSKYGKLSTLKAIDLRD
jgi:hypothetical protein